MLYAHCMTMVNTNINILELFLDMTFPEKILKRQPSIDFDFCNLSSSGDVQCSLQGNRNYSAILATLQITSYALGV
jgi:hypothetical protein